MTAAAGGTERIDRGTWLALVALGLGVFVVGNDFTALSVAIPEIEADLDTTLSKSQWVINGYALVFGVLIVTGGRLADLYGRKRMFMVGAAAFALFSLTSALSPNIAVLVVSRGLMGIGGAVMWPAVLGMVYAILPAERAGLAGGLVIGVAGVSNATGPLLGGVLTDVLSWRWVFLLNLPVAAFAVLVTAREVPESQADDAEHGVDYRGVTLLSLGIVAVLLALDEGPGDGFGDPVILGLLALGAVLLVTFVRSEGLMGERALVPRTVLRNRVFAAACTAVLLMSAIFFAALLYLPQFMQKVLDFSALGSGVGLLPMMVTFAATSFVAGPLYDHLGPRLVVSTGAVALALGMTLLSFVDAGSDYASIVPGSIVLGAGVGLFYSSITTAAVTALDPSRSSLAGGIVYMCQIAGGAVGLGVNTAIVSSADSLTDGITIAFRVDAALAVVGLVVVLAHIGVPDHAARRKRTARWHHRAHA